MTTMMLTTLTLQGKEGQGNAGTQSALLPNAAHRRRRRNVSQPNLKPKLKPNPNPMPVLCHALILCCVCRRR